MEEPSMNVRACSVEQIQSFCALGWIVQGGFFLMKKPPDRIDSSKGDSESAFASRLAMESWIFA
jgi:hypothetical protein